MAEDLSGAVVDLPVDESVYRLPAGIEGTAGRRSTRLERKKGKSGVELTKESLTVDGVFVTRKSISSSGASRWSW